MKKVLIADDEPLVVESTRRLLMALGFHVTTVSEPALIESRLREDRPDVLLQDVRMPGLDIERLLGRLAADAKLATIPVVLFSAGMELVELASRLKVAGILEKPFKPDRAVEVLTAVTV